MLSLKHTFQSTVPDDANPDTVSPSNWNAEHTFTLGADRIVGRLSTDGAAQELTAAQVRTLLNVEDGATADQTGAEILALLLPVDGAGTGLDADLLDGNHASAFLQGITGESIGDLSDVSISDVVTGELLVFQSGAWINQTLAEAGIQAASARLNEIAALAVTDGNFIVGDGTNWVAESGATVRTSLGLGAGNSPQFTNQILTGFLDLSEISTPADPAANVARFYSKDDGGTTKIYFRDSAGNETEIGSGGGSFSLNIQTFASSGTYTPTSGMVSALVFCTGAGGAGADADTGDAGSGGQAGGTGVRVYNATEMGADATVTIGAGGATDGANGGNSSFNPAGTGTTITANGGEGGTGGDGTIGGDSLGTVTGGQLNLTGGHGGLARAPSGDQFGGFGGASFWGGGGRGGIGVDGAAGPSPGSGGGGGENSSDHGDGADGLVVVIELVGA